jgi:hypothetical protein
VFSLQPGSKPSSFLQFLEDINEINSATNRTLHPHPRRKQPRIHGRSLQDRNQEMGGQRIPSGDLKEDEKTVETAASTLVFAALDPGLDGMLSLLMILRNRRG